MPSKSNRTTDETGSSLILVLIFLIVGGLIVGSLGGAVMNDLKNTSNFASARTLQYDAISATDLAIESIRYTPLLSTAQSTLNASPPSSCWGTGAVSDFTSVGGNDIAVWCSTVWTATSANTRVVTFSACPKSVTVVACTLSPLLQAVVTFDDYPPGLSAPTAVQCVVYCGTSETINSWVRSPTVPTVTAISPTSGSITGRTLVTITGTGFVSGTTVSFVEESGGTPASGNVVLPASSVTVGSPTSLTAMSPSITAGTAYFVTVTTPSGTSAYGPSGTDAFVYSLVVPTVTRISATSGTTAGGTSMTITGSGFVAGATVNFVQEPSGTQVSGATSVTVATNTSMTAVSPAVTQGTTYYVTVTTPAGTSASTAGAVFTYSPLVPTVASILPIAGPAAGGTTVTITGTGFVTGATVNFVEESGGSPVSPSVVLPAVSVTVTGPTSITVLSPTVTVVTSYFVTVTTPTNTSNYYPIFTFS